MSRRIYFKAVLVCLLLFVGAHFTLGWLKRNPAFYKIVNNQIASREVLRDIIKAHARGDKPVILILGDSVVYGSGMHAHQVDRWREQTLPAFLEKKLEDYTVIDVSMDGSLPLDYLALYQHARELDVAWVILNLNYRMFSNKYQEGPQAISRVWLLEDLPPNPFQLVYQPPTGDRILQGLRKVSLLFRYSEAMRSSIFFPTREEKFNQWLKTLLPARALREPEDQELLLKLKIKPYYFTREIGENNVSLLAARLLLKQMEREGQNYIVFFTPQNLEFIEEIYNQEAFAYNLQYIQDQLRSHDEPENFRYYNWSALYPTPAFYDHCHLTPQYNEKLAQALAESVRAGHGREDAE